MPKDWALDKINEANMEVIVKERSRGLSEITGRPGQAVHHILGRGIPNGFQDAPPIIKEFWPHIVPGCMVLTHGEHQATLQFPMTFRFLLVNLIFLKYGKETWQDQTYWEWLKEPPYAEYLCRPMEDGYEDDGDNTLS